MNLFLYFFQNLEIIFRIIGGSRKRGYYFVGVQGNKKLISADPHFSQKTENNSEHYYETYHTNNLYLFKIKEMRCQFSLCVGAFNSQQFKEFLEDATWISENYKNSIKFEYK